MRILVTDGDQRAALAVVRSLGRAGHEVRVAGSRRRTLAAASRFSRRSLTMPGPLADPGGFVSALLDAADGADLDMLLPITDASLSLVLRHRAELERRGVRVPFADLASYEAVSDKRRVLEEAGELGIAAPRQVVVRSRGDTLDRGAVGFPAVLKPSRSIVERRGRRGQTSVLHVADPRQLEEGLDSIHPAAYPVLVQERIEGPGVGVFLLRWDGEIVAAFSHLRLREKPPSGGVSVLRESRPMDPELYALSVALLERHDWRGPAMVEFKVCRRTGTAYLMEVNGRYWGSLQLAIDSGVDFPALHVAAAAGRSVAPVLEYAAGVRNRWLLGDVDQLLSRLRYSREALGLTASAPGRGGAIREFLTGFGPGIRSEVFRWSDPVPAVAEARRWVRKAIASRSRPAATEGGR